MKNTIKKIAAVLTAVILAVTGAACGRAEPLPETTSAELGVYVMDGKLVDANGKELKGENVPNYSFDEKGNVVAPGEKKNRSVVVIAADKIEGFTCATEVEFDTSAEKQEIPFCALTDDSQVFSECVWKMPLTVGPADAVNGGFTVTSADPNTICFSDGEESKSFETAGTVELELTARYPGDAKLTVTNCLGEIIGTADIEITPKEVDDEKAAEEVREKISACEHRYTKEIVPPTETAEGYTQYTCALCGHLYRSDYVEKLPCSHSYSERKINSTCTERGYTLCTCVKCGEVTRKDYTDLAPHMYKDEVVSPTCSEKGYTRHTCSACGHSETDTYVETTAHKYTETIVESTCSSEGYTLHTCSMCGKTYKDNTRAMKTHTYLVTTVAPTYTAQGYTLHSCSVCGSSFKDNITDKLVCTSHSYAETGRTEATCTQPGTIRKACTICGATTAESIPANGHHYSESVTQPTCSQNGHTTHTCSVCGNSYTDTETPALGHDWEAHEEEQAVVGSEVHCFCSVCGMDFTANGMGNGVDHQKAHALAGEGSGCYSTLIPIYGTVTTYTCRRCGTTK